MPRIRTIKPEFWDSPSTAKAGPWARLAFIAMWNWADDFGRGTLNYKELEGFIFPHDSCFTDRSGNTVKFRDIVAEVSECFGVVLYEVDGRMFYEIQSWERHQRNERRSKASKYPAPAPEFILTRDNAEMHGISATVQQKCSDTVAEVADSSSLGTGEQGNRGTGEPTGNSRSRAASTTLAVADGKPDDRTPTQTLIAEWLEHTDPRPPGRVVGHLSKEIKTLLDEGQPFGDVRNGLALWARKGLHPASLASCVHESRTPKQPHIGGVDWEAAAARAAERDRNAS